MSEPRQAFLAHLVNDYRSHEEDGSEPYRLRFWLDYFADEVPTLEDAIRKAATALGPEGRKHRHQWKRTANTLQRASDALLAAEAEIGDSKSFRELHELIREIIGPIPDVGELTGVLPNSPVGVLR